MKLIVIVALIALCPLQTTVAKPAGGAPAPLFSCSIGPKHVSVTVVDGQLVYHYGKAGDDELSIVAAPASGNVFKLMQRYAGMEYQLRFKKGDFSYIVFSSEGNGRVGASATSGLVVMRGDKQISDRSCSHYAELTMPDDALGVPDDTDAFSAM